jgi:hypothetical protein
VGQSLPTFEAAWALNPRLGVLGGDPWPAVLGLPGSTGGGGGFGFKPFVPILPGSEGGGGASFLGVLVMIKSRSGLRQV